MDLVLRAMLDHFCRGATSGYPGWGDLQSSLSGWEGGPERTLSYHATYFCQSH